MRTIRRFIHRLNTNPVAQAEMAYLHTHIRSLAHWRYLPLHLLFAASLFAATLPLWFYITIDYTRLLASIMVLVFAAYLVVNLRTALVAARTLSREYPDERWAALASGDYDARQIIVGKWWAAVRATWRSHLFLIPLRAGLAIGLAQHTYDAALFRHWDELLINTLRYYAYSAYDLPRIHTSTTSVMTFVIVIFYSLLAPGLAAVLGMIGALLARSRRVSIPFLVVSIYSLFLGFALILAIYIDRRILYNLITYSPHPGNELNLFISKITLFELSTLFDGGVVFAASIPRPYISPSLNAIRILFQFLIGSGIWGILITVGLYAAAQLAVQFGLRCPPRHRFNVMAAWRRWRNNPLTRQAQQSHQSQTPAARWSQVLLLGLFALALMVVLLSRWTLITCQSGPLIRWMAATVAAFQAIIMFRTLLLATRAMHRIANTEGWEPLVLTGLNARQIVLGEGRNVFRQVWPLYLLIVILKFGFTYSLALYLTDTPIGYGSTLTALEKTFFHISSNFAGEGCYLANGYRSFRWAISTLGSSTTFVSWAIIFTACAVLEALFLIALGFLGALLVRKHTPWQLATAVVLRLLPVAAIVAVWQPLNHEAYRQQDFTWGGCSAVECLDAAENRHSLRILDTFQVTLSTLIDGGIASVNLADVPAYYPASAYRLRQWTGLTLGVMLNALLVLIALRAAIRLTIRRGALPPPKINSVQEQGWTLSPHAGSFTTPDAYDSVYSPSTTLSSADDGP